MKQSRLLLLVLPVLFACKSNNETSEAGAFFPVRSYLQSQVAHIDTSLYNLRKITKEGNHADTLFIPRGQFRKEAADFLQIEDIASAQWKNDYAESRIYDDAIKRAIFSYTPKETDAPILRQDVTIEPGAGGDDAVKTIFINRLQDEEDSTVQKKMLWEVGKRFQIITTVSRQGQPRINRIHEVWWAPFPPAK